MTVTNNVIASLDSKVPMKNHVKSFPHVSSFRNFDSVNLNFLSNVAWMYGSRFRL